MVFNLLGPAPGFLAKAAGLDGDEAGKEDVPDDYPRGRAPWASEPVQAKQRHLRLKTFEEPTLEDLEASYDEWRLAAEEDGFVDWNFEIHVDSDDATQYVLTILFTE